MRKKLSLILVAFVAIAAFAVQGIRRAAEPTALINYPTDKTGITLVSEASGTTDTQVSYATVKIKGTATDGIKFGKSFTKSDASGYYAELAVDGGFKAGDVITINGAYSNADEKNAAIAFYAADASTLLWTTNKFVNVNDGTTEPGDAQTYTLEADQEKLYIGRSGNTATYITLLTITRAAGEDTADEGQSAVVDFTDNGYDNGAEVTSVTENGVTVAFDKGTNSNSPRWYNTGGAVRLYGSNTMTVSAEKKITKIEITFGSGDGTNEITTDVGSYNNGVWEGESNQVVFTVGGTSGHRRIAKLNVTLSDETDEPVGPTVPGEAIWTSDEAVYAPDNVTIAAEKFASATVGDVLHVVVWNTSTESIYNSQVQILNATGKKLEDGVNVGTQPDGTDVAFTLTGDILTQVKAGGLKLGGYGYYSKLITLESTEISGSENSIWVGKQDTGNIEISNIHFANFNGGEGVKNGDIIRVTLDASNWTSGTSGWINLQYKKGYDWKDTQNTELVTITNPWSGEPVDILIASDDLAAELNDAANNHGVIIQVGDATTATQVELIAAEPVPEDIEIAAADITDGDITAALAAASEGKAVKNITITLAEGEYKVTASIVAPNSLTINGNGAVIDASALEAPFAQMAKGDLTEVTEVEAVKISGVTVKGLKQALFYSTGKNYKINDFVVDNSVVEVAADVTTLDFTKGSAAVNFTVTNSTIYAPVATTKSLYSSQGGQKVTEVGDDLTQTFTFKNNTMSNLAPTKNFFSHRQSNQTWLAYDVEGNLFADCGKSGQVIKGMNGGQGGANPTWTIKGNAFNFGGADTSAAEDTGDTTEGETVQNSVAGVMAFTSVETPDFGGTFTLAADATQPETLGDPRWTITYKVAPKDIEIAATDITDGDITAALTAAEEGVAEIGNITINLAEGEYKVTASIVAPANLTINGNGAVIDASALEAPFAQMAKGDLTEVTEVEAVKISGVTVKGLKQALFYSTGKNYKINDFVVDNSVVEVAADVTTLDFTKGSAAVNFTVTNSTIYAPVATTKSLYSSQGGQKVTEVGDDLTQTFTFKNNTMSNLAPTKNFFSHRQSNQTWLAYDVEGNLFADCGKSGQVIKGMNGGQGGANPTWTIKGNAFNFGGADTSAAEDTGDTTEGETVQNSVAGVMAFTSVETPDFGGTFTLAADATAPETLGDPRWTITFAEAPAELAKLYIIGFDSWDRTNMTELEFNEEAQAYVYECAPTETSYFAFADYQQTAEEAEADENWDDFNANHRYAIGEGNQNITIGEEVQLVKVNGTICLNAGTYKISVTKDLKMTITGEETVVPEKLEYTAVYAVGNGSGNWMNGENWNPAAEANKMTKVSDDVWEITFSAVPAGEDYQVKFAIDGAWTHNFGGTFSAFAEETVAAYDGANITFATTDTQDITLKLDLTNFNLATKEGAKFTVTATTTDGISTLSIAEKYGEGAWYTINGQRIDQPTTKGLYIHNGRKVVIK